METNKIYFGFFSKFAEPTILLWGDSAGLRNLAEMFKRLTKSVGEKLDLGQIQLFSAINIKLTVEIRSEPGGMKKISEDEFNWVISPKQCKTFSEHFSDLSTIPLGVGGGHHYLDCSTLDDVTVVVSFDEYNHNDLLKNN